MKKIIYVLTLSLFGLANAAQITVVNNTNFPIAVWELSTHKPTISEDFKITSTNRLIQLKANESKLINVQGNIQILSDSAISKVNLIAPQSGKTYTITVDPQDSRYLDVK